MLGHRATRKDIEKYFNRQETRRALLNQLGELAFPPRVHGGLRGGAAAQHRRRADPRQAVPDRRSTTRTRAPRWSMPAAAAPLRVESFSTHSFMDPDEQAILHRRPAGLHEPHAAAWWRRWARNLGVVFDRAAERVLLIDERAREIPPDTRCT